MVAMQIHAHVVKSRFIWDDNAMSSSILTHGKCNMINNLEMVFEDLHNANVELLNAMTTAIVCASFTVDALNLFLTSGGLCQEMDSTTFCIVL